MVGVAIAGRRGAARLVCLGLSILRELSRAGRTRQAAARSRHTRPKTSLARHAPASHLSRTETFSKSYYT